MVDRDTVIRLMRNSLMPEYSVLRDRGSVEAMTGPERADFERLIRFASLAYEAGVKSQQPEQPEAGHLTNATDEGSTGLLARWHELKTDPDVFDAVASGAKTFEIRLNDRGFQVGDGLLLRKTRNTGWAMKNTGAPLEYTGEELRRVVAHVLHGPVYGLADGWAVLSLAAPPLASTGGEKQEAIESQFASEGEKP